MLIATAGHVDHGKTSLVRCLTGVDTDRLSQEKSRGVSIELGFAYHGLGGNKLFGFVDVPGHEKFIRNMLSGVGAVDTAMLVVAADDGPMPQTHEHLAILQLLGVSCAVVVITKIDRVDDQRVAEVSEQIRHLLPTFGQNETQLFPVSTLNDDGIPALKSHLHQLSQQLANRHSHGRFRMAIDRLFSVAGTGLIATGAVFSGKLTVGDRLTVAPDNQAVRVRGLRIQGVAVDDDTAAQPGDRVAVNLAGADLGKKQPARGDWLVSGPIPESSRRIDASVHVLPAEARALAHWTPVHIYHGASSLTGRIAILQGRQIAAGETGLVQLVLDQSTVMVYGDRFIVRDQSSSRTIAGGQVIDPFGATTGRAKDARLELLLTMQEPDPGTALGVQLERDFDGVDLPRFAQARNLTNAEYDAVLTPRPLVEVSPGRAVASIRWQALGDFLLNEVRQWHQNNPEQLGPNTTQVSVSAKSLASRDLIRHCLDSLVRDGQLSRQGNRLRQSSHTPTASKKDLDTWKTVQDHFAPTMIKPAGVHDMARQLGVDKDDFDGFLHRASERGQLIKVAHNRYFHPQALMRLAQIAEQVAADNNGQFDAKIYRNAAAIGRNTVIQVLEYFDAQSFTRRLGDSRRIIASSAQVFGIATPDIDTQQEKTKID